jgi:hypothetical protein
MKLRGGCLSREDVNKIIETMRSDETPQWQKNKLLSALKSRRSDPSPGASIRGAILDRRIQELAWLTPIKIAEGEPDVPRELIASQIGNTGNSMLAHCFNSHIVHTPEDFYFTSNAGNSPYQCAAFTGAQAKQLCEQKARKNKTFMNLDEKEVFSINEDLNSKYFNKFFNYYLDDEKRQKKTPSSFATLSPRSTTSTTSWLVATSPLNLPETAMSSSTKNTSSLLQNVNVITTTPATPSERLLSFTQSPNSENTVVKPKVQRFVTTTNVKNTEL